MTHIRKQFLTLITSSALSVPLLMNGAAQARSQAAILGHEMLGSKVACFDEGGGGPRQNGGPGCTQRVNWDLPIVYDNAGTASIRVSARGAGSGTLNVSCTAFSATSTGATTWGTEAHTIRNDGVTEMLVTSVYANGFGGTWVSCAMDPSTQLFNVSY